MIDNRFKEIGHYLIQSGLYLITIENNQFEEDNPIHQNIINFLMQGYLFLKTYNDKQALELKDKAAEAPATVINDELFMTKKEVIKAYYPVFTEYGLTQAVHTKGLPFIKRGAKYFFKKSEIDVWIAESKGNCGNSTIKFV